MTQEELDALPDADGGGFGIEERVIDGKTVRVPVLISSVGVLWTEEDEPCAAIDVYGQRWRLGWYKGVRYKRRAL